MTQRERQVLQLIEADPMISQQELADKLGITRSSAAVHISNLCKKGYIAGKGYVLRSGTYVVVVGGVNIDIGGRPFSNLIAEDSNPGTVTTSLGGVGRNIAHNMSLLDVDVRLLTAYGDDANGQRVAASCSELGIDLSSALLVPGASTSTYLYIANADGDMAMAINDMEICKKITPSYLASKLSILNNAQVVVFDTNIPAESVAYLANNVTAPLFCDPVSVNKADKIIPHLSKIHTLKPNKMMVQLATYITNNENARVSIFTRIADYKRPEELKKKIADILDENGYDRRWVYGQAQNIFCNVCSQLHHHFVKAFLRQSIHWNHNLLYNQLLANSKINSGIIRSNIYYLFHIFAHIAF